MQPAMILIFMILTACGSGGGGSSGSSPGACSSSAIRGHWRENGGAFDEYVFKSDCTGTNKNCSLTFSRYIYNPATVWLVLQVSSTSGAGGCPAVGQTDCQWTIPGVSQLTLNCGGGVVNFSKIAEAP